MKTTANAAAAYELVLYAENDSHLYFHNAMPIIASLTRKMRRGQYDTTKACKAWEYFATAAAQKYCREFCDKNTKYHSIFNAATRREVAAQLEERYREQVEEYAQEAK